MADVMPSMEAEDDRAQLILVTALVIAVLFVALALIVNSAIYTENIATRDTGAETSTALQDQSVAIADLQTNLDRTNERLAPPEDGEDDYDSSHSNFRSGIEQWSKHRTEYQAKSGRIIDTDVTSVNGTQIRQTEDGSFESADGRSDWTLVNDTEEAGLFEMTVDADSVYSSSGENQTVMTDESFYVLIDNRQIFIYEDSSGNFTVAAAEKGAEKDGDELANEECNFEGISEATIDIHGGTVNGEECEQLDFYTDEVVGTIHDIEYQNAVVDENERINGTYELIVDTEIVDSDKFSTANDVPSERTILYRIETELVYRSSETSLETVSESIRWSVLR